MSLRHGIRNGTGDSTWGKRDGVEANKKMGKLSKGIPDKAKALKSVKGEKLGDGKVALMKKKAAKKGQKAKVFAGALSKIKK
jgi:hypothetical protein